MNFEKDCYFLICRIIIMCVCIYLILILGNHIVIVNVYENQNFYKIIYILIIIVSFILLFLINTVELKNKKLILKNIYGIKIKEIELTEIKGRKVTQKPKYKNPLFLKKYESFIRINYFLKEGNKNINGHILSEKGLKELLKKTRK